jgi:RNA polymerase sigma factor (sigma-70 family)
MPNTNNNFDEKLMIEGCLNGKIQQQRQLYEHFKVKMFTTCLRYAADRMEAEDMLQDGFVLVFKELHQFDSTRGVLEGWIRRVMINAALQTIRKKKIQFSEITDNQHFISSDDDIVSDLSMKELIQHIQKLPPGYRTVFNMYVIDDMSHNDIAAQLNISVNTSKTQLFKAKQQLKKSISAAERVVLA